MNKEVCFLSRSLHVWVPVIEALSFSIPEMLIIVSIFIPDVKIQITDYFYLPTVINRIEFVMYDA